MEQQLALSVSDAIALINQTLEYAYPTVAVEGEVASFKVSKGKYVFFDLKDDAGVLGCFMMVYSLRTALEDGMRVRVVAQPRLTAWGKFSLTVRQVMPVGQGNIKRSFELLRVSLEKEGLFDSARKRPLPALPAQIGLIASVESAGYVDFLKILTNRWGGVAVQVADVQVQGVEASDQIIRALQYFNQHSSPVEVLVLVRGGGSAEDLAVFNDEPLVRAIAASRIPTLVGVGHEVDVSLADLAADVRAATPSNAAEILVPDRQALLSDLQHKTQRLVAKLEGRSTELQRQTAATAEQLLGRMHHVLATQQRQVEFARQMLRQLNPKTVLGRGYALVRDEQGRVVKASAPGLKPGQTLTIELQHAIINAGVHHVEPKK